MKSVATANATPFSGRRPSSSPKRTQPSDGKNVRVLSLRDTNNRIEKERTSPTSVSKVPTVVGGRGSTSSLPRPSITSLAKRTRPRPAGGGSTLRRPILGRTLTIGRRGRKQLVQKTLGGSRRGELGSSHPEEPMSPHGPARPRNESRPALCPAWANFQGILRKEVIQPQVPLRLPCYDLVPITGFTFGACLAAPATSDAPRFGGLTGGVYKAQEHIHRGMLIRDY